MHPRVEKPSRRPRRGFLLLEALIAGVVLATVLGSAWNEMVRARRTSQAAGKQMQAARYAQDEMENQRNLLYTSLASVGSATVATGFNKTVTVTTVTTNINTAAGLVPYTYKDVVVTVTYPGLNGPASVSVQTSRSAQ